MGRRGVRGMMVAVETAIILPVLLLLVGLLIVLARGQLAQLTVASAAARAASIERTTGSAVEAARSVAASSLSESGVECRSRHVTVDARGLLTPLGTPATVSVTVTCVAEMGVGLPGFPDTRTLTATRTSPVDTYRTR